MDLISGGLPLWSFGLACLTAVFAGFVKGALGFAFPLIMISILPSFMPVPTALAALILPVLATNVHQGLRQGWQPAAASARQYWRLLVFVVIGIFISAPFVLILPQRAMFFLLGVAVLVFSTLQLSGWAPEIPRRWHSTAEVVTGLIGGLYGGISGVWGPPSIVFLLAIKVGKAEMVRIMSIVFALGALTLVVAHLRSGVLNTTTLPLSAALLVPAGLGMWLGYKAHDAMDADRFRRWMLILLCLSAINLLRRAWLG